MDISGYLYILSVTCFAYSRQMIRMLRRKRIAYILPPQLAFFPLLRPPIFTEIAGLLHAASVTCSILTNTLLTGITCLSILFTDYFLNQTMSMSLILSTTVFLGFYFIRKESTIIVKSCRQMMIESFS